MFGSNLPPINQKAICQFGERCNKPDCYLQHPPGRQIKGGSPSRTILKSNITMQSMNQSLINNTM
jgi:hypothetical protein